VVVVDGLDDGDWVSQSEPLEPALVPLEPEPDCDVPLDCA
jgi:hypothetical protein